jgi:hypothetical protein
VIVIHYSNEFDFNCTLQVAHLRVFNLISKLVADVDQDINTLVDEAEAKVRRLGLKPNPEKHLYQITKKTVNPATDPVACT